MTHPKNWIKKALRKNSQKETIEIKLDKDALIEDRAQYFKLSKTDPKRSEEDPNWMNIHKYLRENYKHIDFGGRVYL